MPEKGFPLPGSSYKELIKIIQGYGQVGDNVTPSEVGRIVSIHETAVSKNNKFLGAIGIIQGGRKKSMTSLGKELAHALHHDMKDAIVVKWRAVVEANDFLQKVVAAVRIRKGMDESSLESHVAYSAGQPRTPAVATGAGTVVDILREAEILKEEGGSLVAIAPELSVGEQDERESSLTSKQPRDSVSREVFQFHDHSGPRDARFSLQINLRIECTVNDIDEVGPKLRKLIDQLNGNEADELSNSKGRDLPIEPSQPEADDRLTPAPNGDQ
jgi:hypothetical protein